MIKIEVQSTRAVIRYQATLTAGLRGAKAQFTFARDWDGLIKTAVFRQGDKTVTVADIGPEVTVPWEVLTQPGLPVQIGVYGIDSEGTVAIPTVWAVTQPVRPGAEPEGDPSTEPTPGLWEQLQGKLGSLEQLDTTDQSSLVAAINEANRAVYVVNVTKNADGTYSADKNSRELLNAYSAGKMLFCNISSFLLVLTQCNSTGTFEFTALKNDTKYRIVINQNGTVEYTSTVLATKQSKLPNPKKLTFIGAATAEYDGSQKVVVEIPNPEASAPVYLVTVNDSNKALQSFPDILAAHRAGQVLQCDYRGYLLPLKAITDTECVFSGTVSTTVYQVTVRSNSRAVIQDCSLAKTTDIPTRTSQLINDSGFSADGGNGSGADGITPNVPTGDVGGLETIIDFTATEDTTEIRIPIDTEEMAEKIKNANDLRFYVSVPQDTSNTELTTIGSVSIGFYMNQTWQIVNVNIIPPANTNNTYGMTNVAYFRNKSAAVLSPMIVVTRLNNQGSKTEVRCAALDTTRLASDKGHYFYVTGSQNMKTGTRVIVEVRA